MPKTSLLTPLARRDIADDALNGHSVKKLAKKHKVSTAYIYQIVRAEKPYGALKAAKRKEGTARKLKEFATIHTQAQVLTERELITLLNPVAYEIGRYPNGNPIVAWSGDMAPIKSITLNYKLRAIQILVEGGIALAYTQGFATAALERHEAEYGKTIDITEDNIDDLIED